MKKIILIFACAVLYALSGSAQKADVASAPPIGCIDKDIALRAEDINNGYLAKGMEIYKEASMNMESEMPAYIEVKLEKGHWYQFIFVGSDISAMCGMDLFDGEDNPIIKKEIKRGEEPGYISFGYLPTKTDIYLVILRQKQRRASMCGSITIFDKPNPKK
jgi:hypothetical protein